MKRHVIRLLYVSGVFLLEGITACAAPLTINKVMFTVPGVSTADQWIEVANTSKHSINLGAKTVRLIDTKGRHYIKPSGSGSAVVPAGDVVVIAQNPTKYLTDAPNYKGVLLKSAFRLSKSGTIGIVDGATVLATEFSYAKPTGGKVKQIGTAGGNSSGKRSSNSLTSQSYAQGTFAPADSADAASAGALGDYIPVFSSVWFAAFLALVSFSGFAILVLQRHYYL